MIFAKANEIKQQMERKGFTGKGLSEATRITQGYLVKVLAGKKNILATTAKKICMTLDCQFDDIFISKE